MKIVKLLQCIVRSTVTQFNEFPKIIITKKYYFDVFVVVKLVGAQCKEIVRLDAALAALVPGVVRCSVWNKKLEFGILFYLNHLQKTHSLQIYNNVSNATTSIHILEMFYYPLIRTKN